jgi:hypothetical protein
MILLILDSMNFYKFTTERLIVIGGCVIITLIPFFSEVKIKDFLIKKDNDEK